MKRFKFRLERVLEYKRTLQDEKKRILLIKNQQLFQARDHLDWLEHEIRATKNEHRPDEIVRAGQYTLQGDYWTKLKRDIENQKLLIMDYEKQATQAQAEYVEASKEVRSLEILKERKQREYLEYISKEEDKFLDELTVQRFAASKD